MIEIYGGDATYLTLNTSFFFLVVYLSAALNALLITTSLYSTYNYQNKVYEVAEVQIKVSHELLKMNDKLSSETTLDYLTNLGNRKALMTDTKNIWDEFSDENRLVSVAMIDVDKFKPINDTYGHEVGDVVLKRIAQIISEISISFNGSAYRYGGEEFIMIFKDIEKQTAQEYMDNLSKHISYISFPEIENKKVSVSIGIYTDYPTSLNNFQDFLSEADRLMYIEKNKKKMKF